MFLLTLTEPLIMRKTEVSCPKTGKTLLKGNFYMNRIKPYELIFPLYAIHIKITRGFYDCVRLCKIYKIPQNLKLMKKSA